jgi:hypothetical protein
MLLPSGEISGEVKVLPGIVCYVSVNYTVLYNTGITKNLGKFSSHLNIFLPVCLKSVSRKEIHLSQSR